MGSDVLDTLTTTTQIVLAAALYVSAGKAHWVLINQADIVVHPDLAKTCEFRAGLEAGHLGAHFTRWCFILFWPFWLALGWLIARCEEMNGQ